MRLQPHPPQRLLPIRLLVLDVDGVLTDGRITLTADGEVVHDFISHYYPNVLEAMRTRWISPQIITTNRVDAEAYEEVKELGKRVIDVLGIETSATHMEWFYGPKGLRFSEIACRPPGVGVWDLYGSANDLDLYVEWAKLIAASR